MKIGVLGCGFNCAEHFKEVLEPWVQYKEKHGDLIISVVSGSFKENAATDNDGSQALMKEALNRKEIDYLALPHGAFDEKDMRNFALSPLLRDNVEYIILLDFDEVYTLEQIENIFNFVKENPFTGWFKIRFKNYVIDNNHYVDDFCPPRIFKVSVDGLDMDAFYFDNDINYTFENKPYSYKELSSMTIPRHLAFVNHYSWCGSPERLKAKIDYQNKHFNGICSYVWDEENNRLALNYDFYKKHNVPVPIIYEE